MTNRQRVIDAVRAELARGKSRLAEEVQFWLDTWSDDPENDGADEAEAFWQVWFTADATSDRALSRACNGLAIDCGYLRARSPSAQVVFSGRDRAFRRGGVRYDCVSAWCIWIDE